MCKQSCQLFIIMRSHLSESIHMYCIVYVRENVTYNIIICDRTDTVKSFNRFYDINRFRFKYTFI